MMQLGILGAGNMGGAILRGLIAKGTVPPDSVTVYNKHPEKAQALHQELGVRVASSVPSLFLDSDMILLAVKPNMLSDILAENAVYLADKAVVSIIAGWDGVKLRAALPESARVLRVMPNTPSMVGAGMIVFENGDTLTHEEHAFAETLFSATGVVAAVEPYQMDAVIGVSGSGPAYVYMFIDAMADGGVQAGLPRSTAIRLAAQTVLGSAKMVLESGMHPDVLKDMVCSPGGTTIDAVASLEKTGFRGSVIEAVQVCAEKSARMNK